MHNHKEQKNVYNPRYIFILSHQWVGMATESIKKHYCRFGKMKDTNEVGAIEIIAAKRTGYMVFLVFPHLYISQAMVS